MPKQSNGQRPLQLLTSVPSKDYSRLMVRYPYQTDDQYAHAYHFAAQRLATTFGGEPIDDLLLLPFLTLYRQAFEHQLKNTIRSLVGLSGFDTWGAHYRTVRSRLGGAVQE